MGIVVEIQIELSCYPGRNGALSVLDEGCQTILGPFPVAGKLCAVVCDCKNTEQDLDTGGVPSGAYVVQDIHTMAGASLSDIREFGRYGIITLAPWVGEEPGAIGGSAELIYLAWWGPGRGWRHSHHFRFYAPPRPSHPRISGVRGIQEGRNSSYSAFDRTRRTCNLDRRLTW